MVPGLWRVSYDLGSGFVGARRFSMEPTRFHWFPRHWCRLTLSATSLYRFAPEVNVIGRTRVGDEPKNGNRHDRTVAGKFHQTFLNLFENPTFARKNPPLCHEQGHRNIGPLSLSSLRRGPFSRNSTVSGRSVFRIVFTDD